MTSWTLTGKCFFETEECLFETRKCFWKAKLKLQLKFENTVLLSQKQKVLLAERSSDHVESLQLLETLSELLRKASFHLWERWQNFSARKVQEMILEITWLSFLFLRKTFYSFCFYRFVHKYNRGMTCPESRTHLSVFLLCGVIVLDRVRFWTSFSQKSSKIHIKHQTNDD